MNEIELNQNMFDRIKHIDEFGEEYWLAREIMPLLEYSKWENFSKVIRKAIESCQNSNNSINEHFPGIKKTLEMPNNATKEIQDYKLSRYACYLIAQNGDSRKKTIALAQTYFAIQTRRQELNQKGYNMLTEDEKRFYQRDLTKKGNYSLNLTAMDAGVKDFAKFHNAGYKGLYNGETADDIAKRKGLRYREDILDNMSSEELVDNLFRIVQTNAKLKNDHTKDESKVNIIHYEVGNKIRNTIKELGGTMPEDLPTPNKSLKELAKEKQIN